MRSWLRLPKNVERGTAHTTKIMLERTVERYLVEMVKELGGKAFKFTSPGHSGVSDRIVVLPGNRVWFVELKSPTGRLTPLQENFAREIKGLQGNYACLHSKEEVREWLTYLHSH